MGFLDKVKAATEQAATRAKEELGELQTKRELNAAYGELGQTAFDLVESGVVSHDSLTPGVERIRSLKAQLADLEAQQASTEEQSASSQPPT